MSISQITKTRIGEPIRRDGLSIFPLFHETPRLDGIAIADETLEVSELQSASVPELEVHNPKPHPVVIPAGRVLEGGRQTRVVNVSIIVPAGARMVIPVSCVESGRWAGGSTFRHSHRVVNRHVRHAKSRGVKRNIDLTGRHESDQGMVWDAVRDTLQTAAMFSPSESFLEADRRLDIDERLSALTDDLVENGLVTGQTGIAVAVGDRVVGVELFTSADDLASCWTEMVRLAVGELVEQSTLDAEATVADVEKFLAAAAEAPATRVKGTGLGTEYHVDEGKLVAHALVDDAGNLIHAFAFVN